MAATTNAADGRTPIFRSPSAKFRMRNHDRARNADGDAFGSVGEARADPDTMITRRWSAIGGCASALARSHPFWVRKNAGCYALLHRLVFALANKGTIRGHCRLTWATAISSPVRYTEVSPDRFKGFWRQWGFCASTASEVGRVKISILLWRYGRIAGKLVPPWGNGRILVRMNDGISLLEVMRT